MSLLTLLYVTIATWSCIIVTPMAKPDPEATLLSLSQRLRAGDYRMVRPSPSEKTALRQDKLCDDGLNLAFSVLMRASSSMTTQELAATVINLCTTNNPTNRAKMWEFGMSVHVALISLVNATKNESDDESTWRAAAAAAEAIWISSYNSTENYSYFIKSNALEALSHLLLTPCNGAALHPCHFAQMWGAAAIQNLAASYCYTDTGLCWWEYNKEKETNELDDASPLMIDGEPARELILKDGNLVSILQSLACQGPVKKPHLEGYYIWPGRATVGPGPSTDSQFPSIVPWAAAGAIRNLMLSPKSRATLDEDIFDCLCDLVQSPDWLEQLKAKSALSRTGHTKKDCPKPYDATCRNTKGWKDTEGYTCKDYEKKGWCVEWSEVESDKGVKVKDACCACEFMKEAEDEFSDTFRL